MEETKKWHQSLGEWGAIIVGLCGVVLPILGKANYAAFLAEESAGITEWLAAAGTLIGGAMAFWGRFKATKRIE